MISLNKPKSKSKRARLMTCQIFLDLSRRTPSLKSLQDSKLRPSQLKMYSKTCWIFSVEDPAHHNQHSPLSRPKRTISQTILTYLALPNKTISLPQLNRTSLSLLSSRECKRINPNNKRQILSLTC